VQAELEQVLEPFTTRVPGEVPADAGSVRIMAFFMPEASQGDRPPG
jgi:hypothetical protein